MDMELKAYELFDKMVIGQVIVIDNIAKKDPEAFLQYAKNYIDAWGSMELSMDMKRIIRVYSFHEIIHSKMWNTFQI